MLNTIPVDHDSSVYVKLIKKSSGKHVTLGLTSDLVANMIGFKTGIVGPKTKYVASGIGSIRATQEVGKENFHFCPLSSVVCLLSSCFI